jgi:hypothetical protein
MLTQLRGSSHRFAASSNAHTAIDTDRKGTPMGEIAKVKLAGLSRRREDETAFDPADQFPSDASLTS